MPGPDNFTGRPLPGYQAAECVLRREAAQALARVQADLAEQNLGLKVYDCYRPTRAVAGMARWARQAESPDAPTKRFYPALDRRALFALGYIAAHSAHSTGVAVDLTLIARDGKENTKPSPAFDPAAHYGRLQRPGSTARAGQFARHGHRLRLLRRQEPNAKPGDLGAAETPPRHPRRRHAPARLAQLFPRMVALHLRPAPGAGL